MTALHAARGDSARRTRPGRRVSGAPPTLPAPPTPPVLPTPTPAQASIVVELGDPDESGGRKFVEDWFILGPISFKVKDPGVRNPVEHAFVAGEANLDGTQAPPGTSWKTGHFKKSSTEGRIDLGQFFNGLDYAVAYAVTWIDSPREHRAAKLRLGGDDHLQVWVNGRLEFSSKGKTLMGRPDQYTVEGVAIQKGLNRVVVKCVNLARRWNFYFRLVDSNDMSMPVKAVRPSLAAE